MGLTQVTGAISNALRPLTIRVVCLFFWGGPHLLITSAHTQNTYLHMGQNNVTGHGIWWVCARALSNIVASIVDANAFRIKNSNHMACVRCYAKSLQVNQCAMRASACHTVRMFDLFIY